VLFGLIHATYLTPFQVILPTALGLAFGVLRNRVNLWAPVAAHTLFNAVMLLSTIYGEELAFLPLF
jgi:membrane protease YdiL (CAAX protease family)